ncbi:MULTISPECIES: hypothetical protein [unclassified Paracoccus (in: a-proteobacteria)]|uniref:hypothetical protein n=1 Tax=unclassified Paracoccus (in: a-proteobacteria) TaxID=2688777 RepID=UPI0015FFCFB3|nr:MULTISPECIES: hypothetical protein [unclassified Paracoccus (in: a-proteobacteria)]MBB1491809.1 hypothetical protein [Paracoccus sp. MC1854]MBB1496905.1 hypothetical protein [Paracoccus sp. MC1862]QQO45527.1 hypothetical protein JGR78_04035 [Paracoccus sp. MC1862]
MALVARIMSERLGPAVPASLSWPEIPMVAGFVCLMLLVAPILAWQQLRRDRYQCGGR